MPRDWLSTRLQSLANDSHTHLSVQRRLHKIPIRSDGHGADDFPLAGVVIEAPEGAFLAGAGFDAGDGVGEVREADGGGAVEVRGAVALHGDDEREVQAGRQGRGQAVRGHGGDADLAAARAVVAEDGVGRDADGGAGEAGIGREHLRGEGDGGVLRLAGGLERAGADAGQIDEAGASGEVVGLAGDGFPLLADGGEVLAVRPCAPRGGAAVDVDEEHAAGAGREGEVALGIRGGAHGLLLAVHGDGDAGHADGRVIRRHGGAGLGRGLEHASGDAGGGDAAVRVRVEAHAIHAACAAIAIGIKGAPDEVGERGAVEGDLHPRVRRQRLQVEERGFFPVRRNLHAAEHLPPGELGVELGGVERGIDGQWDGEMHDGLAVHRHIALTRGWRCEAHGGERQILRRAGLQHFLDQLIHIRLVHRAVLGDIRQYGVWGVERGGAFEMLDDERDVAHGDDAVVIHVAEVEIGGLSVD